MMALHAQPGEVYNICSGSALPVQDLADKLIALSSIPMRLESDPELQRGVDIPVLCGDASRLRNATGWAPTIPIEQTLADVLAQCREVVQNEHTRTSAEGQNNPTTT